MEQIRIVKEVLHSRRHSDDIRNFVKGVMIESYIEPGNQKVGEHIYGKSITDRVWDGMIPSVCCMKWLKDCKI